MDLIRFGSFLAQLRREKGLTQQALGERLGVTNKTVSRWETLDSLQDGEVSGRVFALDKRVYRHG